MFKYLDVKFPKISSIHKIYKNLFYTFSIALLMDVSTKTVFNFRNVIHEELGEYFFSTEI